MDDVALYYLQTVNAVHLCWFREVGDGEKHCEHDGASQPHYREDRVDRTIVARSTAQWIMI